MDPLNPPAEQIVAEINEGIDPAEHATVNPLAVGFDYGASPLGSVAPHPVDGWGWIKRVEGGWTEGFPTPAEAQSYTPTPRPRPS